MKTRAILAVLLLSGLFLAQQLLALQNGELIFSGEPELGSTFSFTLETANESNGA